MKKKQPRRVLVFGVFDLLHPGHHSFLRQAKEHGAELIAVVARGSVVRRVKGMAPHEPESVRLKHVTGASGVFKAVLGDVAQGAYRAIHRFKPDVICCGYDQKELASDLKARMAAGEIPIAKIVRLKPHHPHRFKSSIEREKKRPKKS